jgi:hypothetical protein
MDKDRTVGAAEIVGGKVNKAIGNLAGDQKDEYLGQGEAKSWQGPERGGRIEGHDSRHSKGKICATRSSTGYARNPENVASGRSPQV